MGKKYIIELEDKPFHKEDGDFLYRVKGFNSLVFDMTGIGMLTPYTEPDLEQVRKEEYDRGYDDAKGGYENGFENGMIVAWEAARKIVIGDINFIGSAFGSGTRSGIIRDLTASEVIKVLKDYEQKQDAEIKVGDEVETVSGKAVIIDISDNKDNARYIYSDSTLGLDSIRNLTKTGRHFPEIAAVLEKMRGEQDG